MRSPQKRAPQGRPSYCLIVCYSTKHIGSGGCFTGPALPARLLATPVPIPPPQRSVAEGWPGAGAALCGVAAGLGWPVPGLWTEGLVRLVSEMSFPALAPPMIWAAPATPAGWAFEFDNVAAPPQAAVRKATATIGITSLFIALLITQRPPLADGLDAALPRLDCYRAASWALRRPSMGSRPAASRRARSM
jgi:hypothetical protein